MNLQTIQNFIVNYKKGTYTKATWKSEKVVNGDTYTKVSEGVVRFVSYTSVKKTTTTNGKTNPNQITYIENVLFFNTKTNNYLVHLYVSKNPKHKTKTTYYLNGNEITKAEYESNIKVNKYPIDLMFTKNLNDIISLG